MTQDTVGQSREDPQPTIGMNMIIFLIYVLVQIIQICAVENLIMKFSIYLGLYFHGSKLRHIYS